MESRMTTSTNNSTNQSTTNGTFLESAPAVAAPDGAVNGCYRQQDGADGNAADASSSGNTGANRTGPERVDDVDDEQFTRTAPQTRREGHLPGQIARDAADREAYDLESEGETPEIGRAHV